MSFSKMTVKELKTVASSFALDLESSKKEDIIAELENGGVTWGEYQRINNISSQQGEEDKPVEASRPATPDNAISFFSNNQDCLVKFIGHNRSIEVQGLKFTLSHPFQVLNREQAQDIMDVYPDKFRLAGPKEADQFYK